MTNYLFYRLSYLFAICLPLRWAHGIATGLSYLKYWISPRDRHAVMNNLRKILPPQEQKNLRAHSQRVFTNFGRYLIEFFRVKYLKKEDIGRTIFVRGVENVEAALKRGHGVIAVSAHLGNWEMGAVVMALLGYPMVAVALPHRHPKVNAFFNRQRERIGVIVVPSLGGALRGIYESLGANRIIALLGDRVFGAKGKPMEFLGETKNIPRGPAVLAVKRDAALVMAFAGWDEHGRHIIEFSEVFPQGLTEDEYIEMYTRAIESKIRQNPTQWLMFREFWRE